MVFDRLSKRKKENMSIPKKIHYCWFGHGEIPERDQRCIESWKKFCPDYEIILWNEDNYDVAQIPYTKEAYEARRWAFVSDFARIDIVCKYGGVYMDTDVELIRPLDSMLEYSGFAGTEADSNCIAFGLGFGAEAGLEILHELCEYYKTLTFQNEDGSLNMKPNPIIVTEYLREKKGIRLEPNQKQYVEDLAIFPPEYFCPQNYSTGKTTITEKTISIHHYHASWQTEEEIKELRKYRAFTRLLGNSVGELVYQGCKTLRERGPAAAMKKVCGYIKRR